MSLNKMDRATNLINMFVQCVLIGRGKTQADHKVESVVQKTLKSHNRDQIWQHPKYKSDLRLNKSLMDSPLAKPQEAKKFAESNSGQLDKVDIVLTSPLLADLQTVAELFTESKVDIYILPQLAPRVNSADCIPTDSEDKVNDLNSKVEGNVYNKDMAEDLNWFLSYGGLFTGSYTPQDDCLKEMSKKDDFESYEHYHKRLNVFKSVLPSYKKDNKQALKAIVARPEVLEALVATGVTDKYQLINKSAMEPLEMKKEFIVVNDASEEAGVVSHSGCCWC